MQPQDFIKTIYLGDRGCEAIVIDTVKNEVKIKIDEISRIKKGTKVWGYYNNENIEHGFIVFSGVKFVKLDNAGHLPNGFIVDYKVVGINGDLVVIEFEIETDYIQKIFVNSGGFKTSEGFNAKLTVSCASMYLEDPKKPGEKITE